MMLHALLMAGGGGTRFWPRSRQCRPKQFLALGGERTLLQQAFDRLEGSVAPEQVWVITAAAYMEEVARQLPEVRREQILGEPCGRDTAACIAVGAALISREDAEATMVVTPADHVIEPVQEFRRALHVAVQTAQEQPRALVTFGIPPTYPATGYGYLQRGEEVARRQGVSVYRVRAFREKPDADLAERFVASGEYFWNSGIFVWKAAAILAELRAQQPALAEAAQRIADAWPTPERQQVLAREYEALPRQSIDYAVMEHAGQVLAVPALYRWDDVGSWLALERLNPQDVADNTVLAHHVGLDTNGCVLVAEPDRLIVTLGVSDLLIVQDGDVVLVAAKDREGDLKKLVEELRQRGLENHL
jgi:mannose-1-phosphate guanylyltransferase